MRKEFAEKLEQMMRDDDRIFLLTADMGFGLFDGIKQSHPHRSYNTGAAEQATVGIACGLALSGKVPVCYSITPFMLFRPFELIRNYMSHEGIAVKLVGSGRGDDYKGLGFSHYAGDDAIIESLPGIQVMRPSKAELNDAIQTMMSNGLPTYLNLERT